MDASKPPLRRVRWLGLIASGAALAFAVLPPVYSVIKTVSDLGAGCDSCPSPPLADGIWFALGFSLVALFASIAIVSRPADAAVFTAAGGLGLLATGLVVLIRGLASPRGEAWVWAIAGMALTIGAAITFRILASKQRQGH
jgi:hypothetical protein